MTDDAESQTPTAIIVTGYRDGEPFPLDVLEVECGKLMSKPLVSQVKSAIRAGRDAGLEISISSAWRSMEEQEKLYEGWKAGLHGYNPADKPGHSKHQDGTAIDLAFASGAQREEFAALALAWGLTRPTHEKWHWVAAPLPPKEIEGVA